MTIQQLKRDLAKRDAEITALKELLLEDRLKPKQQPAAGEKPIAAQSEADWAKAEPPVAPASRYPSLCYEDYCPCKPPQGGPDEALCTQLEQGKDPSVDLMKTGRELREERRQMASGKRPRR